MKVYALLGGYDYEGLELLGVYASRDEAVEAYELVRDRERFDTVQVETRELGAPAAGVGYNEVEYI